MASSLEAWTLNRRPKWARGSWTMLHGLPREPRSKLLEQPPTQRTARTARNGCATPARSRPTQAQTDTAIPMRPPRSWPKPGPMRPAVGRNRPQSRSRSTNMWSSSVQVFPMPAQIWSRPVQVWPSTADEQYRPTLGKLGPPFVDTGQIWSNSAHLWSAKFGRTRPDLADRVHICSTSAHVWSASANSGRTQCTTVRDRPIVCRKR